MGEPPDRLLPTAATTSAIETVAQVRAVQSQHWRSIYPKGRSDEKLNGENTIANEYLPQNHQLESLVAKDYMVSLLSGENNGLAN